MKLSLHRAWLLVVVSLFATVALAESPLGFRQSLPPHPGKQRAPDFELPDENGKPHRLSDYRGRVVVLNFWATWCPPCREEMPSMERARKAVANDGIVLLAVNVGEDADTIFSFTASYPVGFPLLMDRHEKVIKQYPVIGLPTTFVIDPDGTMTHRAIGGRDWDDPGLLRTLRALRKPAVR